jgi:kynurenine formamidase
MTQFDLTHPLTTSTPVYPGDDSVEIIQTNKVISDGFSMHQIKITTHIGTHIDAPAHMIENGKNIDDYPINHFIGNGIVIDARTQVKIDSELLEGVNLENIEAVLIFTGRDKIYSTSQYFTDYPEISTDFAQKVVDAKIKILGMDQASPDYSPFATHKLLLQNDVLIIENLTKLDFLLNKPFTLTALPLSTHTEAAPVRVIATLQEE